MDGASHSAVEELKRDETVRVELAKATGEPEPTRRLHDAGGHKAWLVGYAVAAIVTGGLFLATRAGAFDFLGAARVATALKFMRGAFVACAVLGASKAVGIYLLVRIEDRASRFNVERLRKLLTGAALVAIAVSALFADWYTAVVSLGLISLILGFALQAPITSFLGWIYILLRKPYRVGDRIQVGNAKGDVIDVSYLDTTLWEVGGPALSSDHPSGRVIKFPNRTVLDSTIYNSSWPLFPYVWNEISVQVAYNADLDFVATTMRDAAKEEVGREMTERVATYKELLAKTPVDEVQVKEQPAVLFRVSSNTWVEASVRYLVMPRQAGAVRSRLVKKILERLNAAPERSMLPKSDSR